MSFVDTPGILSGSEARLERGYDLIGVLEWFAERVDRILLLFDVHQLDISDELLRCISALRGCEDKVRMVLNKADGVDPQQVIKKYTRTMVENEKKHRENSHSIIHCPMIEGVSKVSERANE